MSNTFDENIFISHEPNGSIYLDKIDFEIPKRILNIIKNTYFSNELDFYKNLENILLNFKSYYLFPNDYVSFYPHVVPAHSSREISCNVSGAKIKIGELYYYYRPLIENLTTTKVYTIQKTIKVAFGYQDILPQTLAQYEEWYQKSICGDYNHNDPIDFYELTSKCGNNCLFPHLLKK